MDDEILTIEEVAKFLKLSEPTIYRLKNTGLPYFKIGRNVRFKKKDILDWLEENKKGK